MIAKKQRRNLLKINEGKREKIEQHPAAGR